MKSNEIHLLEIIFVSYIFFVCNSLFKKLAGFDSKTLDASLSGNSPVMETKKSRTNIEEGVDGDWDALTNSPYALTSARKLDSLFGFRVTLPAPTQIQVEVSSECHLFTYLPYVLFVLHLLYEDLKLDTLSWADTELLVSLLIPLASALNLSKYCDHYWRDFPLIWDTIKLGLIQTPDLDKLQSLINRIEVPANIFDHLMSIMQRRRIKTPYPHIKMVNTRCKDVVTLYAMLYGQLLDGDHISSTDYVRDFEWVEHVGKTPATSAILTGPVSRYPATVLKMSGCGWTIADVNLLPAGVGLPLRHALYCCQLDPPTDWPDEAYLLVNRKDMSKSPVHFDQMASSVSDVHPELNLKVDAQRKTGASAKDDSDDGMEEVVDLRIWKMLFPKDHRIQEVRRLLSSSRPVTVVLPASQQQGLSEHELIEEREKQLLVLCIRVMALPIGRGMFTLHTTTPTVTETLAIPK